MCALASADGAAAMVAAAVRAAVLAKAPRRTVAAVAAAVASALARSEATAAVRRPVASVPAGASSRAADDPAESHGGPSPEELLKALRSARAAQRRRRKLRRRAVKEAGRAAETEEGMDWQPQEPDHGGDPAPSLPAVSASPAPQPSGAAAASSHDGQAGPGEPPRKLARSGPDDDARRSVHSTGTVATSGASAFTRFTGRTAFTPSDGFGGPHAHRLPCLHRGTADRPGTSMDAHDLGDPPE
mmetsp:Transcript_37065/g.119451  ORF Transcript_37065/g.119451 Transcript_37065/m.119451 type:complete len:243 (-) Transcript_37065:1935-2663(-)